MPAYPSVDECRDRLHRAGWSIGETAIGPDFALVWCVTGTNGEQIIKAEGRTQGEAWRRAVLQAECVLGGRALIKAKARSFLRGSGWLAVRGLACLSWLWLGVSLPFLTDASCFIFVGFALAVTWLLLAGTWLFLCVPSLLLGRAERLWWLAAGAAGCLGLVLAFSDVGLMARIALCESSLSSYAVQVPPGGGNALHASRPVGLFLVDGEENYQGIIFLYTSSAFINREGVAFVPPGTFVPSSIPRRRLRHLYGSWYWFSWKF